MKKRLLIFIFVFMILIIIKYCLSNYNILYKVDNYSIKTVFKDSRAYYEISDGDKIYNFDYYIKRGFKKYLVKSIDKIDSEEFNCIFPKIDKIETYPLCYMNDKYIDYNLIDSELLDSYKTNKEELKNTDKNYNYFNNLDSNEYVALWNYKGYIVMNKNSYKIIDLFDRDKYDNSLAVLINNKIYMSNNDEEHEFSRLVSLDLKSHSIKKIDIGYNIDYDSYIVGVIGNNLYIFDDKYSILYEINVKKEKTKIIGNNEKGYVKYENGKFVSCSKTDYKVNKIKYNINNSIYKYIVDDSVYKIINDNNDVRQKIINSKINVISEKDNTLYYQYEDNFYKYDPKNGIKKVFYYYELNFNAENTIFVYVK